jgi:flagellar hook-basal body complex protein FliE
MSINAASAAGAYTDAIKRMADTAQGAGGGTGAKNPIESFGDVLAQQVNNVESAAKTSEAAATKAAAGQGNLVDLVTQVAEAEVMLQTAVSVRDKVVNAYQEIMRMPI